MNFGRASAVLLSAIAWLGCGDDAQPIQPSIALDMNSLTVAEGDTLTFTVTLTQALKVDGAVQLTVADGTAATISPQVVTFTAGDLTPKTIMITGAQDDDLADEATSITASAAGANAASVDLTVTDDDTQAIVLTNDAVTLTEGGTGTVGVRLAFQPSADTAVTIAPADTARLSVAPATATFTAANYSTPQTITLSAAQDADVITNTVAVAFSSADLTTVSATATITDDDTQGITVTPGALNLTEGGTPGTFQVTLNQQPSSDVVINLASTDVGAATISPSTLTLTAANYNNGATHTVTVTPVDDDNTADESLSVTLSGAFTTSVPVTVDDDDVQAIVLSTTSLSLDEGDSTTLGVALAFDPGSEVTVTVAPSDPGAANASPTTLTFDSGNYATTQSVTVNAPQDADLADESTNIMLASSIAPTRMVDVMVDDDDSQSIVLAYSSAPGALDVQEGTSALVGVSLAFQPAAPVTVTVGSNDGTLGVTGAPLTFTPANYNQPQQVTLAAAEDANLINENVTVTFTGSDSTTQTLSVTMLDNDVQGFNVTPLATIDEGSSQTFNVSFNFAPSSPTVVTLSLNSAKFEVNGGPTAQITIQDSNTPVTVTVSHLGDADAKDDSATLTLTASGVSDRTIQVNGNDDETMSIVLLPATTNVDGDRLDLNEGGTTTFTVHLTAAPTVNTTVTLTPSTTNTVTLSTDGTTFTTTASLTFTAGNFGSMRTITVRGLEDPNLVDETFNVTASGTADLEAPDAFIYLRKIENDAQSIITTPVAPGPINVVENGSATFSVRLEFQPATTVQITVTPNHPDSDIEVNGLLTPTTLLFTTSNYDQPQTITVTTPNDMDQFNPASGTIVVSSPSLTSRVLDVDMLDDDDQVIELSPSSLTIDEPTPNVTNTFATFSMRLRYEPTASDETITLTVPAGLASKIDLCDADGSNCDDTKQVVFTNQAGMSGGWDQPVTLRVNAVDDNDIGDHLVNVDFASNRLPNATATLPVTVLDDDTLGIDIDTTLIEIAESPSTPVSDTFEVKLNYDPVNTVTVNIVSDDTDAATVSAGSLTFTGGPSGNWNAPQIVTVNSVVDDDVRDESVTITLSSPSVMMNRTITVDVDDPDQQAIELGGTLNINEGSNATLTVRLAQQPSADVVVDVASLVTTSGNLATGQVVTLDGATTDTLTFTSANWNVMQNILVAASEDDDLDHYGGDITVTQTMGSMSGTNPQENAVAQVRNFLVRDNDTQSITVIRDPVGLVNSAQEGGPLARFWVRINSRPRLGLDDTVRLTSPMGRIRFDETGSTTLDLTFNVNQFGPGNERLVEWYVREWGSNDFAGDIALTTVEEDDDQTAVFGAPNADGTATHGVRSIDDDNPIIGGVDLPTGFNGATNFTQRSNIAFGLDGSAEGIVAFTARTAVTGGNAVLGFTTRVPAAGNVTTGPQFATGGLEPTTEIVLFDPDNDGSGSDVASWIVFSSSASGLVYNRYTLAGTLLAGPVVVSAAADNPTDFTVARAGVDGTAFGVVYRRESLSRNNLYFRSVSIDGSTVSSEQLVTSIDGDVHFHPTLLWLDGDTMPDEYDDGAGLVSSPWVVLYSHDGDARIVRLAANGGQLEAASLTSISGGDFPGNFATAIVDSGFEGIRAAAVHPTGLALDENAVFMHWIWWGSSGSPIYDGRAQLTNPPLVPVSPPVIAFNGVDFAVAFDDARGGEHTVGVALYSGNSGSREFRLDANGDEGVFPAITWALDRWILRYQATSPADTGIRIRTGSFEGSSSAPQ